MRSALGLVLAALLAACAAPSPTPAPAPPLPVRAPHVVIVSVDGLRLDAIGEAGARTMQRLMREGAHSPRARTITPSRTLPSHASMLTGVPVEAHGITWNTHLPAEGVVEVPTIFELARAEGYGTAAFFGKRKLLHLVRPGSLDRVGYPRTDLMLSGGRVAEEALQALRFERPNLLFVHIPDPDLAGHALGWMSPPYRWAVRRADRAVEAIWRGAVEAFGEDVVLIVTADHGGGEGRTHGLGRDEDVRIPWIAWGAGVAPGEIEEEIDTYDTAATALWLLGIPPPEEWAGRPVTGAFRGAGEAAAP